MACLWGIGDCRPDEHHQRRAVLADKPACRRAENPPSLGVPEQHARPHQAEAREGGVRPIEQAPHVFGGFVVRVQIRTLRGVGGGRCVLGKGALNPLLKEKDADEEAKELAAKPAYRKKISDHGYTLIYSILHGGYCFQGRESRPKVWYRVKLYTYSHVLAA